MALENKFEITDSAELARAEEKISKFRFAPVMYLEAALKHIDDMLQSTYDEIIENM